jgi:hypothetical protein
MLPHSEFQLFPIEITGRDGASHEFRALIPLNEVVCTDIARSMIGSWIIDNEVAAGFRDIVFRENCLGDRSLARDAVTSAVVVTDRLKQALEATREPGLNFVASQQLTRFM